MNIIIEKDVAKKLHKFIKNNKTLEKQVSKTLSLLERDISDPSLKTHKLNGELKDKYACSINYSDRFVFSVSKDKASINILFVGNHNDVY